jgi:type IV pilus assembly protein PilX
MRKTPRIPAQRGAVLIVSLLFLVVLTMLGITAMTGTTFEERMAGNARDAAVAHHAAEAALRRARQEILFPVGAPKVSASDFPPPTVDGACEDGLCASREFAPPPPNVSASDCCKVLPDIPKNVDWGNSTTKEYLDLNNNKLSGVSQQPRYIMELFCMLLRGGGTNREDTCRVYRFTAVGWGRNPNTRVMVQETYIDEHRGLH